MRNVFYDLNPEPLSWKEVELEMDRSEEGGESVRDTGRYIRERDRTDSERLVRVETVLNDMDHKLFGNGRPGKIEEIEARIKFLEDQRNRIIAIGTGIVFVIQFLTGNGAISLKTLLGK